MKHQRIIKVLFWALVVPLLQERDNDKTLMVALRTVNELIDNDSSHEHIVGVGKPTRKGENQVKSVLRLHISPEEAKSEDPGSLPDEASVKAEEMEAQFLKQMDSKLEKKKNPLKILVKIAQTHG